MYSALNRNKKFLRFTGKRPLNKSLLLTNIYTILTIFTAGESCASNKTAALETSSADIVNEEKDEPKKVLIIKPSHNAEFDALMKKHQESTQRKKENQHEENIYNLSNKRYADISQDHIQSFYIKLSGLVSQAKSVKYRSYLDDSIRLSNKFKKSNMAGVGIGYEFNEHFRIEAVLNRLFATKYNESDEFTPSTLSFKAINPMLQAYFQYKIGGKSNIYLSAGGGTARISSRFTSKNLILGSETEVKSSNSSFVYSLGLGVSLDITERLSFDIGGKYTVFNKGPKYSYKMMGLTFADSYGELKFKAIEAALRFKL